MPDLKILQLIVYTFALWLGLYMLGQHFQKPAMRFTGLGLLAYALGLAINTMLVSETSPQNAALLWQERAPIVALPVIFWLAALRHLLPSGARRGMPKTPLLIVLVGSIFFALSVGMAVLPQAIFASDLVVVAVGLDLVVLGYGVAALDAFEEGEALFQDALRSFGVSMLLAIVFGGQVVIAMWITGRSDLALRALLLAVMSTAIIMQTLSDPMQALLDRILLSGQPQLQTERANLRAAASALSRIDNTLDVSQLSRAEFNRLTRRALSHMGNLRRLASSPLTRLPVITKRLSARSSADSTLERAVELKVLLAESIAHLKPRQSGDYGTTDEWRYYNALYYPYVLGIKPLSQQNLERENKGSNEAVLAWFRTQVPERTLHNWQNAAAELIAQELWEQTTQS